MNAIKDILTALPALEAGGVLSKVRDDLKIDFSIHSLLGYQHKRLIPSPGNPGGGRGKVRLYPAETPSEIFASHFLLNTQRQNFARVATVRGIALAIEDAGVGYSENERVRNVVAGKSVEAYFVASWVQKKYEALNRLYNLQGKIYEKATFCVARRNAAARAHGDSNTYSNAELEANEQLKKLEDAKQFLKLVRSTALGALLLNISDDDDEGELIPIAGWTNNILSRRELRSLAKKKN